MFITGVSSIRVWAYPAQETGDVLPGRERYPGCEGVGPLYLLTQSYKCLEHPQARVPREGECVRSLPQHPSSVSRGSVDISEECQVVLVKVRHLNSLPHLRRNVK